MVDIDLAETRGSAQRTLAQVAPTGGRTSLIRVDVPMGMPPGRYRGHISVASGPQAAVFEVGSRVQLRIVPDTIAIQAAAGDNVDADLTVVNVGNAPWELRNAEGLGLYEVGAAERAIGQAFIAEPKADERLVDRLAQELRAGHGGILRIAVQAGGGVIGAGEARPVRARLHFPEQLRPGRRYLATWPFHEAQCRFDVTVPRARASAKRRAS